LFATLAFHFWRLAVIDRLEVRAVKARVAIGVTQTFLVFVGMPAEPTLSALVA